MKMSGGDEVRHELHHTSRMFTNPDRWYFARDLGSDPDAAGAELDRIRALAEGNETGVTYRVERVTREVLEW